MVYKLILLCWLCVARQSKAPKIRSFHIFAISPKNMWGEAYFFPADKHNSFLQLENITLGVHSQAFPKYPK